MRNFFFITIILVLCSPSLFADGASFSGDISTSWGIFAPWTNEDTALDFSLGNTNFAGKVDAWYGNSSALAEAAVSYDALTKNLDFSLGELWVDYTSSFWGLRIGRQKAAWGKADGIDITNVLCPSDMSSFSAMTGDAGKLAVDAIRLSFSGNSFTADAWWIPFFTPTALPLDEGNSLRKFVVPATVDYPIPAMNTTLHLPVTINQFEKPELAIWNGEYGLKFSGYFSVLDLSLYGFYGWDDNPLLEYGITFGAPADPSDPSTAMPESMFVSGEYKRMSMVGADAALPIGPTVLRLEAAFFPQRYFQKSAEEILKEALRQAQGPQDAKRNQLSALAGLDWMPSGWTFTTQYYCDYVFGDLDTLERTDAYQHGATLSISKSLINETLELSFAGVIGLNDYDSMLSPSIKYSLSDQISLDASAYIFLSGPDRDGQYGAYKDLSTIAINASFKF
ncbi:MAG: hypothetical protein J6W60_02765 [Treponema sp.]|nr:hypothetical protein [Treponema sp.]